MQRIIAFCIEYKFVTILCGALLIAWGLASSPFDVEIPGLPRDPVSVDAIPDIGENQQILVAEWPGHSPQDIDDQVTYPLTSVLMGIPGVKTVRSNSMFGLSSIYVIFNDDIEFYWARSRILEKLNALPPGLLPSGVVPTLGPDATGLGQVFWYTLEGRDSAGNVTGGWSLQELRRYQDFVLKFQLQSVQGVAEVASIGGLVTQFHVDVDPLKLETLGLTLSDVVSAVRKANKDVGARTIEVNRVEYIVRGVGAVKSLSDLRSAVVAQRNVTSITLSQVARIQLGPDERRGVLDKGGVEAVGGVVVSRYGANPLETIENVKAKLDLIGTSMPTKVLPDGTISTLHVVPFYDRSTLIRETIATLEEALALEILITLLVVMLLVYSMRASIVIAVILPVSVLLVFVFMKHTGIQANIVALSGIAIAIGTMVDLGVIVIENVLRHRQENPEGDTAHIVRNATTEVAPAILTAVATTIVSFVPVFALQAAEGKLFHPLAFTKTFALIAALLMTFTVLPALATIVFSKSRFSSFLNVRHNRPSIRTTISKRIAVTTVVVATTVYLAVQWMPLGYEVTVFGNVLFVVVSIGLVIGVFAILQKHYEGVLLWLLENKKKFLLLPILIATFGGYAYTQLGVEFMPALDEGSFLLMPTTTTHSGVHQSTELLRELDMRVEAIPEVHSVVGKLGRVESALDPAPVSMYENVINYYPEYAVDEHGKRLRFAVDEQGLWVCKDGTKATQEDIYQKQVLLHQLLQDDEGEYLRLWRNHIRSTDDIWTEIVSATAIPGVTSAPKLQPIETRLVMLQTGMRAPMGIKVYGDNLDSIQMFAQQLANVLMEVPAVKAPAVFAERIVGKPYLHVEPRRDALVQYGLTVDEVLTVVSRAVGGVDATTVVDGRQRFDVRVRYPRELRDNPEDIKNLSVYFQGGRRVRVGDVVEVSFHRGPQMIRSEDTFLVGYVLFDKVDNVAEITAVLDAKQEIEHRIASGALAMPRGITFAFSGNYEHQIRAQERLSVVVPVALLIILIILYLQFRSLAISGIVFSGIALAFSGGFLMLWLYNLPWLSGLELLGLDLGNVFNIEQTNLSVAVWVGFIALFGIATDDGVLFATVLEQRKMQKQASLQELRASIVTAGKQRVRAASMTSATTLIALMPILTSTGRGADIMIPMAIPAFGGMFVAVLTYFVTPVLYAIRAERLWRKQR